ncbi:hypothetical protein NicSoilB11_17910 [Arthrobacter sp. NicSoilB11]|nr:hypothetical protein NicSoilB11_17910 [Arthrobacter sp. NicSoilB11]
MGRQGTLLFLIDRAPRKFDGTTEYLRVTVELKGLRANKSVYDQSKWAGLLSFFEELALNRHGWDGEKKFDSVEGDFRLCA